MAKFSNKLTILTIVLITYIIQVISANKGCPIGEDVLFASQCTQYGTKDVHCCFMKASEEKVSMCIPLSNEVYNGSDTLNLGGKIYCIDCGVKKEENKIILPGSPCGVRHPVSPGECNSDSSNLSSCCFYSNGNDRGCFHLGIKQHGKIEFGKYSLDC